jgi:hypothetical protein
MCVGSIRPRPLYLRMKKEPSIHSEKQDDRVSTVFRTEKFPIQRIERQFLCRTHWTVVTGSTGIYQLFLSVSCGCFKCLRFEQVHFWVQIAQPVTLTDNWPMLLAFHFLQTQPPASLICRRRWDKRGVIHPHLTIRTKPTRPGCVEFQKERVYTD